MYKKTTKSESVEPENTEDEIILESIVNDECTIIKDVDYMAKDKGFCFYSTFFLPILAGTIKRYGTECPLSEHYSRAYERANYISNKKIKR